MLCNNILSLAGVFTEVPNRKFDHSTFWGELPNSVSKLIDNIINDDDKDDNLHAFTKSIFGLYKNDGENNEVDIVILDKNIIHVLEDDQSDQ